MLLSLYLTGQFQLCRSQSPFRTTVSRFDSWTISLWFTKRIRTQGSFNWIFNPQVWTFWKGLWSDLLFWNSCCRERYYKSTDFCCTCRIHGCQKVPATGKITCCFHTFNGSNTQNVRGEGRGTKRVFMTPISVFLLLLELFSQL